MINLHHFCIAGIRQIEIDEFTEVDASFSLCVNLAVKITENI